MLYYNRCMRENCLEQIGSIASNKYSMISKLIENDLVIEITFDGIILGDCLIPRVYFIESLENPKIK